MGLIMFKQTEEKYYCEKELIYQPGRFEYLMNEPFAVEIWNYLKTERIIELMINSTKQKRPAVDLFLSELESSYGEFLNSGKGINDDPIVMVNNMIKQIMDQLGYEHKGCSLYPEARYIKSSGIFEKRG